MHQENQKLKIHFTITITALLVATWILIISLVIYGTSGYERMEPLLAVMLSPLLVIFSIIAAISGSRQLAKNNATNKIIGGIALGTAALSVLALAVVLIIF